MLSVPKGLPEDVCWLWLGSIIPKKNNRAIFHHGYKPQTIYVAARIMWFITYGEDPFPLLICHRCDNPQCINPKCMFKGTTQENTADRDAKGKGLKGVPLPFDRPVIRGNDHWTRRFPEKVRRGSNGGMGSHLTEADIIQIRKDRATMTYVAIGLKYNISKKNARLIAIGESWEHVPFPTEDLG